MSDSLSDVLVPRGSKLIQIVDTYGPLPDQVKCGLEWCRQSHRKGFVIEFTHPTMGSGAQEAIIGHNCGDRWFGASWERAKATYDQRIQDAKIQAARNRFLARAAITLPKLRAVVPKLRWQLNVRRVLFNQGREAAALFAKAYERHHGRIKLGNRTLYRLKGGSRFWATDEQLRRALDLETFVTRFLEYAVDPDATVKGIEECLEQLSDFEKRWQLAQDAIADADEALRPGNLENALIACNQVILSGAPPAWIGQWQEWNLEIRVIGVTLEAIQYDPEMQERVWAPVTKLGNMAEY